MLRSINGASVQHSQCIFSLSGITTWVERKVRKDIWERNEKKMSYQINWNTETCYNIQAIINYIFYRLLGWYTENIYCKHIHSHGLHSWLTNETMAVKLLRNYTRKCKIWITIWAVIDVDVYMDFRNEIVILLSINNVSYDCYSMNHK